MATGGKSGNTSDETFDMLCSTCKEQKKNVEAETYCVDCQDYYCAVCLKLHKTLPALRGHKLLNTKADETGTLIMVPTERCDRHNYKPVDMFCQNHDVVGCGTCIAVDHRTCPDVFYIPEVVSAKPNVLSEFQQRMATIETRFTGFLKTFEDEGAALETNKQNQIDAIKSYAKKLEENIKNAERDAVSKVETRYNKLTAKLNGDIVKIQNELQKFVSVKNCINSTKENKAQAFVAMKLNQSLVATAETTCEDISHIKLEQRVHFTIDPKYEELCNRRISLGAVRIMPYSFTHSGTVNVKLSSDSKTCAIYGSCVLPNGSLVFADSANKNVKLVDSINLTVVDHFNFRADPWDVCQLETNEIGVSLPSENKIKIFKVGNKLFPKSEIILNIYCRGMSFMDNILYITERKCIHLCDLDGTVVKTIAEDALRKAKFWFISHIFVSDHSKNIFVNDWKEEGKGVACLDDDGKILNVVSDEIAYAHDMTDAGNGKVFACGLTSRNVIILSENGEFESVVIRNNLTAPVSLCFDLQNGRLFVANCLSNDVQIFEAE